MELKDSFSGWGTNVYMLEKDSVLHFSTVLKTGVKGREGRLSDWILQLKLIHKMLTRNLRILQIKAGSLSHKAMGLDKQCLVTFK